MTGFKVAARWDVEINDTFFLFVLSTSPLLHRHPEFYAWEMCDKTSYTNILASAHPVAKWILTTQWNKDKAQDHNRGDLTTI